MSRSSWAVVCLYLLASPVAAQNEISGIPFDSIPPNTSLVSTGGISLEGDTEVSGKLTTTGEVETGGGVRFLDGTLQTSAAASSAALQSLTANGGLYGNTIADFSPAEAFTEVCFKAGAMQFDIHAAGESTAGGNCVAGDTGWIIERFERDLGAAADWTTARANCLMAGMRLPEPFEIQLSCDNSATLAINDLVDDQEWATNEASTMLTDGGSLGLIATVLSTGSCDSFSLEWVGRNPILRETAQYRCVR
ncbi:MAG: hypothetical protein MI919_29415 [Holophagales bacterium]|nr:hypothetical protein [Holophagales bacterium]